MNPIPLRDPDGLVYAYACGACHRVVALEPAAGGRGGREFAPQRADRSRRRAALCCVQPQHSASVAASVADSGDNSAVELAPPAHLRTPRPASGAELARRYGFKPMSEAEFARNVAREAASAGRPGTPPPRRSP
ncbi:MAG: hypothetical protein ACLQVI_04465 [Polyangiaceae bacterium]